MSSASTAFNAALFAGRGEEARRLLPAIADVNQLDGEGVPPLFHAVLSGNLALVEALLARGADPNLLVAEPAATAYDSSALNLALGARFLLSWPQFDPIVRALITAGAKRYCYDSHQFITHVEPPTPNPALQRTATGGCISSESNILPRQ